MTLAPRAGTPVSLPILSTPTLDPSIASPGPRGGVDRSRPYKSCEWLEGGLAFNRRSLHACLIVHHGRGFPHLCDFNGGEIPVDQVLAARDEIIRQNQGDGHPACRGCAHLVERHWPAPRHAFDTVGVAQFARCNIYCNYCYLQTQDPASFEAGFDPYAIGPAVRQLLRDGLLAPRALIDWGGGEPTIYPEFDEVLELTTRRGARHWIHTNGTRLPAPLKRGLPTRDVNVLCSVDAGRPETYFKMKRRDFLDRVWRNLAEYRRLGCFVVAKYIVKEENCTDADLVPFIGKVRELGLDQVSIDIDYDYPHPSPAVMAGLRRLKRLAERAGYNPAMGFTGVNFTPEAGVVADVEAGSAPASPLARLVDAAFRLRNRAAHVGRYLARRRRWTRQSHTRS